MLGGVAALFKRVEPGNLDQLAASEKRGSHEERKGAPDVAEEVDGPVADFLSHVLVLEILKGWKNKGYNL